MKPEMGCKQIDGYLDEGRIHDVLPVEAARHMSNCRECRDLCRLMRSSLSRVEVPSYMHDRILQSMRASMPAVDPPGPLWKRALILLSIGAGVVVVAVALAGPAAALNVSQHVPIALILLAGAAVVAFSVCVQMIPGSYQAPPAKAAIPAVIISIAAAIGLIMPWWANDTFPRQGLRCLARGIGVATLCAAPIVPLVRRWAAWHCRWLGASIGLFAGIAGASFAHLDCQIAEAPHQLLWHTAILLVGAVAGVASARVCGRNLMS
jgi:hypothetical protein